MLKTFSHWLQTLKLGTESWSKEAELSSLVGVSKSKGRCRDDLEVLLLVGCLTDQFETWQWWSKNMFQRDNKSQQWRLSEHCTSCHKILWHFACTADIRMAPELNMDLMWNILPGNGPGSSGSMPWHEAVSWLVQVRPSSLPPPSSPLPWPGLRRKRPEMCGWAGVGVGAGAGSEAAAGDVAQWSVPHWEHRWGDPQRCGRWSSGWMEVKTFKQGDQMNMSRCSVSLNIWLLDILSKYLRYFGRKCCTSLTCL